MSPFHLAEIPLKKQPRSSITARRNGVHCRVDFPIKGKALKGSEKLLEAELEAPPPPEWGRGGLSQAPTILFTLCPFFISTFVLHVPRPRSSQDVCRSIDGSLFSPPSLDDRLPIVQKINKQINKRGGQQNAAGPGRAVDSASFFYN